MKVKPICVVYIPDNISDAGIKSGWSLCNELMEAWNNSKPDYHWFCLIDYNAERIEFKVFHEKDFTPIQYEELKKLIEDSLPQKQNPQ